MSLKVVPKVPRKKGNSKISSPKKQVSCAIKWCFVLNNYTLEDIENIVPVFKLELEKWIFELEIGDKEETPHLQGFIMFKKKSRPFELNVTKKIKWIQCDGSEQKNITYCSKDYVAGVIPRSKLYKSENINIELPLKIITDLRKWQLQIMDIVNEEPNFRTVTWIYENKGKIGKSQMARYLLIKRDALYITQGKKTDIMNMVYNYILNKSLEIVVVDIPRAYKNMIDYTSLEEIKNGIIANTKFETGTKVINPPHIIVFSNFPPIIDKLSLDRWDIREIVNNELISRPVPEEKIEEIESFEDLDL